MIVLRTLLVTSLAATLATFAIAPTPAAAQWIWKDEAGHVMASDQPPPVGTPESHIVKKPRPRNPASTAAPAAADPAKDSPSAPAKSLADRDLDSKLKQKEAADAAKKAEDDATRANAMKQNCSSSRGNLAALQSGGRAARFNEKGEKVFISDADRQGEISKQQSQITQYCGG